MRRITLWALSTLSAVVLLFGYHTSTSGASAVTATPAQTGSHASTGSASTGSTSGATAGAGGSGGSGGDDTTPSASPSTGATTAAGTTTTVVGSVAQTRWGPVQVQLTLSGGKVSRASVLQYPDGNGRDQEINDYALPILTRETVDAQSADIDMVSGATVTSDGYVESLQSALDKAGV